MKVVESAIKQGLEAWGVVASPLPGPSGNVEYFLWLRKSGHVIGERAPIDQSIMESEIRRAVDEGPQ